jgi:hypothetical protein
LVAEHVVVEGEKSDGKGEKNTRLFFCSSALLFFHQLLRAGRLDFGR